VAFALAIAVMLVCGARRLGEALIRVVSRIPVIEKRSHKLSEAHASFMEVVGWVPMTIATLLSVLSWGSCGICLMLVATAFPGVSIAPGAALVATSAPLLAGAVALIPGGLGATEFSMTGILVMFAGGVTASLAVAITMLFRLITFWFAVCLGLGAMATWGRLPRRALVVAGPDPDHTR
jgi:uncharacterized protein (TIRG00374 family)